jgi:uric acid transporter
VFMMLLAPVFGRLIRFFPPLVTGTIILIIGVSLMRVAAGWFGGGTGASFGDPKAVGMGFFTLIVIIAIERFAPESMRRVSILLGLVIGTVVAVPLGMTDWSHMGSYSWFGVVTPFQFGVPAFEVSSIIALLIVAIVIMTETTGDIVAVGEIVEEKITPRRLADGLRADGLGTVIGGIFNTFPYTAFAQNVGLVAITGVRTRHVATVAGMILILLGLLPKMAAVVEGIPLPVLGGAGVALFGMVAASGVRTLTKVKFDNSNILVVAISVGVAMLTEAKLYYTNRSLADSPVNVSLDLYSQFPDWFQTIFHSGISAGALTAIVLNLLFRSRTADPEADSDLAGYDAPRGALPDPLDALRAADPATAPQVLRELAEQRPELRTIIVSNPSTDAATCAWLREQGDPQVTAVCQKWDDVTEGRFSRRGG